jgi:hypothetical protein
LEEEGKSLDSYIARLISLGHVNVWEYGYSFFIAALEDAAEFQVELSKIFTQAVAAGIGLSFASEKKQKEFLKDSEKPKKKKKKKPKKKRKNR